MIFGMVSRKKLAGDGYSYFYLSEKQISIQLFQGDTDKLVKFNRNKLESFGKDVKETMDIHELRKLYELKYYEKKKGELDLKIENEMKNILISANQYPSDYTLLLLQLDSMVFANELLVGFPLNPKNYTLKLVVGFQKIDPKTGMFFIEISAYIIRLFYARL